MKKSNLWASLIFLAAGVLLLLAAFFPLRDTHLGSLLCGFGTAALASGAVQAAKYWKWTRPQNADVYREKLEQEQIDLRDERKSMLRDRSGRYAYLLGLVLCAGAIVVLSVLGALEAVENTRPVILFLGVYLVVEYAAGIYFYRRLEKKY